MRIEEKKMMQDPIKTFEAASPVETDMRIVKGKLTNSQGFKILRSTCKQA